MVRRVSTPVVDPSNADSVVSSGSDLIGGPLGRFARRGLTWWLPIRVLVVMTAVAYTLGYVLDLSCRKTNWVSPEKYEHLCFSDIPALYTLRGFADGYLPYIQTTPHQTPLEYPVLTGAFMYVANLITNAIHTIIPDVNMTTTFYDVNVIGLFIPLVAAVVAMALTVRRRPWDAAMLAIAPTVIFAATINWDLLPLGFIGIGLLLWARNAPFWCGIFLGLAIAAKFYPLLFFVAFFLLALRSGKWRPFARLAAGSAIAWAVVNLPIMVANFDGWSYFYLFSKSRGQDFGSLWFAIDKIGLGRIPGDFLNLIASGLLIALLLGIGLLSLTADRRPRLAQLLFLVVAAFLVTNKVYSPQYVLWLVPLAAMARPKWRDFLIWQAGELMYFVAIWWFVVGKGFNGKGLPEQWYGFATLLHIAATCWLAGVIVRDIRHPEYDIVRTDGFLEDADDPAGGPFNDAVDVFTLRPRA